LKVRRVIGIAKVIPPGPADVVDAVISLNLRLPKSDLMILKEWRRNC
jgi:hypothetical protein